MPRGCRGGRGAVDDALPLEDSIYLTVTGLKRFIYFGDLSTSRSTHALTTYPTSIARSLPSAGGIFLGVLPSVFAGKNKK